MAKFIVYAIFIVLYFKDLESIHSPDPETGKRNKDTLFYICKTICFIIQIGFLIYEGLQFKWEGK